MQCSGEQLQCKHLRRVQAASDNLGELPPGLAMSQGPVKPVSRQGPNQDAPDCPPGYHAGQLGQASSASMCQ